MLTSRNSIPRTCSVKRDEHDKPVQNGLALTPAQMAEMAERGIPISTANAQLAYEEGDRSNSFDIPVEDKRGVDMADVWVAQQDARKRVKDAYLSAYQDSLFNEQINKQYGNSESGADANQ